MSTDKAIVILIPAATDVDDIAVGTYKLGVKSNDSIALQFIVDGADAAPKFSLYGSNDNVNWDRYELNADGDTDLTLPVDDSASYVRDTFPHRYLSVSIDKNSATTGTITCNLCA